MGQLERVKTKAPVIGSRILLYGGEGEGKSSLAAQFKDPIFLMGRGETGLLTLMRSGQLPETPYLPGQATNTIDSKFELETSLRALKDEKNDYKTAVLDSWSSFERLYCEYAVETQYKGEWGDKGFASFQKGWDVVTRETEELFDKFIDPLCEKKGMNVIVIAHSTVTQFKNPEDMDYDRFTGSAHKKVWQALKERCDEVWFMNSQVEVIEENKRGKGQGEGTRYLYTRRHAAYDAKSRMGLPPRIQLGKSAAESYAAIMDAMTRQNGKGE